MGVCSRLGTTPQVGSPLREKRPTEQGDGHPKPGEVPARKKRRKPTSEIFPRSSWPDGYTKEMVDGMSRDHFIRWKTVLQKEKILDGKKSLLPGKCIGRAFWV